jgi:CheY-like chemotaxis protein
MLTGDRTPAEPEGAFLLDGVKEDAQDNIDTQGEQLAATPTPAPVPNRRLRVLVVDDNQDAADSLGAVAELLDCDVQTCYDGATALAAISAELPDVLLLDLTMPRVSGLEVAAGARMMAGRRPLLLVATTALSSLEDRTETALSGFHYHLVKPISIDALRAALDRFREIRSLTTPFGV